MGRTKTKMARKGARSIARRRQHCSLGHHRRNRLSDHALGGCLALLPRLGDGEPAPLLSPARVSERAMGKIAHLDGLNRGRRRCAITTGLTSAAPLHAAAETVAQRHLDAALPTSLATIKANASWPASPL